MPRPPDGRQPRDLILHVRITRAGRAEVDRLRGARSVSEYVRSLIAADAVRRPRRREDMR